MTVLAQLTLALALTISLGCSSPSPTAPEATSLRHSDLAAFHGKVVLLTFGATWCPMCSIELRDLEAAQHRLDNNAIQIVAVLVDEDRERVQAFVREHGLTFPVLRDDGGALQAKYKVLSLPATIALDARGNQIQLLDPESGAAVLQIDGPRNWDKPRELELLRQLGEKGK